ncbi:MAG: hypothetical protein ACOH5I_00455 [Oligoflexus sp.]
MKVMKSVSALILAGGFVAGAAYANPELEALKNRCDELSANQQLRPFNVGVTCRQVGMVWKESEPVYMDIANGLEVSATITVKEALSELIPESVTIAATPAACSVFEQFDTAASVDLELTCAEIAEIESFGTFCYDAIQARVSEYPDLIVETATGQYLNTCQGGIGGEDFGSINKK